MFWGLILKANKRYTQVLEKPFHLSQAALDHSTADNEPVQVMYSHEDRSYLLCTLQKGNVNQCMLDLNFAEGDKLCFLTKGNGIVHLTGFLIPESDEFGDFDDEDDEELEDENELPDLREKLKGKQQKEKAQKPAKNAEVANKKKPVEESDDDEEEDSDDSDADESELQISGVTEEDNDEDDDSEEEGSDDDDDEEEEDDSEEEEEEVQPQKKKAKLDAQQNSKKDKQNGLSNGQEKKKEKNKPQEQNQKPQKEGSGQMQKLQGGLMYQDLKVGNGAEAKPGKKIQVYYEGKLKSNNKTFDSSKSGPGFKMTLGRGEVIKGWDIGLQGMKVGGKRKLIIPPGLGYGQRGNPPVIPPNSTLVFDVELKNVF